MNIVKIKQAELEAIKLIRRCRDVHAATVTDQGVTYINGSAETSALKRQSMELTRALAELRKPG